MSRDDGDGHGVTEHSPTAEPIRQPAARDLCHVMAAMVMESPNTLLPPNLSASRPGSGSRDGGDGHGVTEHSPATEPIRQPAARDLGHDVAVEESGIEGGDGRLVPVKFCMLQSTIETDYIKQNRSTEGCSKLKSGNKTRSGEIGLSIVNY